MTTTEFTAGGKVIFWSLRETDRAKLHAGLTSLNLQGFTPEPKTDFAALKAALQEVYGNDRLIRPLAKSAGYEVVSEIRGDDKNEYNHVFSYPVDVANDCNTYCSFPRGLDIHSAFVRHKNILCGTAVTTALVKIVSTLQGTLLRPQGGIYWIADTVAQAWQAVAEVVEGAGIAGNAVFNMSVKYDADMVKAVSAAIVNEIAAESEAMEKEITAGECGGRALENRRDQAMALRAKVKTYESLLAITLPKLTEGLEKVSNLAAVAIMDLAAVGDVADPEPMAKA